MTAAWALVAFPALPLLVTVVNLLTWRPPARAALREKVSALVPARDEVATIGPCVRALLAEPVDEVVVLDDGSTDGTAEVLRELAATEPRLRVLTGGTLPKGWVGKPHACHLLAAAARNEALLFVDADVRLLPGGVGSVAGVDADLVTAFPGQQVGSASEAGLVGLLHLTYLSWLPLALIPRTSAASVLAANGQVLFLRRAAYDRIGGFEAVRDAIVDDMALCRRAKQAGLRVAFVPGERLATCRMYRSGREAFFGFSKNLYPGLGSPAVAAVVAALYTACFVAPWLALPWAPVPAAIGIALNLAQRASLAVRFGLPASTVVGHLPSALAFLALLLNSARWTLTGALRWRGRTYAAAGGAA